VKKSIMKAKQYLAEIDVKTKQMDKTKNSLISINDIDDVWKKFIAVI